MSWVIPTIFLFPAFAGDPRNKNLLDILDWSNQHIYPCNFPTMDYYVHPFKVDCTVYMYGLTFKSQGYTTNLEELIIIRTKSTRIYPLGGGPIVGFESLYRL